MNQAHTDNRTVSYRFAALLMALVLLVALLPAPAPAAAAESSWLTPYLEKLVSWGVMRGDQNGSLDPDRAITRAEFVSMINRAYGYTVPGQTPFQDVMPSNWFFDDIGIGYRVGYFTGASATEALPLAPLSREQATVIISRNMMLQESVGEMLGFTDSRNLSSWSRGSIKTAAEQGIIKGYPDGSFQPQRNISRGEVAVLIVNAIGTPISTPGEYTLGSIYGNVTISSSGVTLRNTTIAGDLYITGGVGLGHVTLENVTVLGKIVASGAGESNKGDSSVILRNVTATDMVVDSIANRLVTIRAEGDTAIGAVSVRTQSYLEDATGPNKGFAKITVDGEAGTVLEAAGSIKEVIVQTPNATLLMAKGQAQTVTVDETAPGATVNISAGAEIINLNLDVATKVIGKGDISHLTVNSAGSSSTILPDQITIRPGLTANISGEVMDTVTAAESSEDPRLLSGYPKAGDLAPTSASVIFRTNKKGTIHWAISSIADGSVGEADLIKPPTYATKIVKSGTLAAGASNTDYTVKLSGLTSDGSYYISAILVDARGQRSPVKVSAFTTPDGTTPGFASAYPVISKLANTSAQAAVMPTKTCQLYYAVLPKGATAPTGPDFKAGAITGNLGYGTMEVTKNVVRYFDVTNLKELETYDIYFWLTDLDGAKNSAVKKLSFTTVDRTPPIFLTEPTVTSIKETSVGLTSSLNEAGTIFWSLVKQGTEYPKPLAGQIGKPPLTSDTAKLQVANGMNALKSGKATAAASKDTALNITGLAAQTAYDLYYVAQDKAGNYSDSVKMVTIYTLDTQPPIITQEFTRTNDASGKDPTSDTDVRIIFSEGIQDIGGEILMDLYNTANDTTKPDSTRKTARDRLTALLRKDIQLFDATGVPPALVKERTSPGDTDWTIDYSAVKMAMDDGKTVVTFENGKSLNLKSGGTYYFQISDIADTSNNKNIIKPNPQKLSVFKTVFAQVNLKDSNGSKLPGGKDIDMTFQMLPQSTGNVDPSIYWDMLIWSDSLIKFELYQRTGTADTDWALVNPAKPTATIQAVSGTYVGVSLTQAFKDQKFDILRSMNSSQPHEYGIRIVELDGINESDRSAWNRNVHVQISIAAGGLSALNNLSKDVSPQNWTDALANQNVTSIGWSTKDPFTLETKFTDSKSPSFIGIAPEFTPTDTQVAMDITLDRAGTIYYAIAPVRLNSTTGKYTYSLTTKDTLGNDVLPTAVPKNGSDIAPPALSLPLYTNIVKPNFATGAIKSGNAAYKGTGTLPINVSGLEPDTLYYAYFVLKGVSSSSPFSEVLCYQFTTKEVVRPIITLYVDNPNVAVTVDQDSLVDYLLVVNGKEGSAFNTPMSGYVAAQFKDASGKLTPDAKAAIGSKTVLQAMSEPVMVAGKSTGSIFDKYASQDAKDNFANLIRNTTVSEGTVVMKGQQTFLAKNPMTVVDCRKNMSSGTMYTFLTVGHSPSGSGDAFSAALPVFLRDSTPPVIVSCTTVNTGTGDITSLNDRFTGYVIITFSEDLYYRSNPGSLPQMFKPIEATAGITIPPGSRFVPIGVATTSLDPFISLAPGTPEQTCSSLRYRVTQAPVGAGIQFSKLLSDSDGNTWDQALILTLNYEPQKDASGTVTSYRPYFTITPAVWDGTK